MKRSMRPRSRKDTEGMSPKELEGSTRSADGLNMKDRAEIEKMNTLRRASSKAAIERNLKAEDPRIPGVTERKAADKEESKRIYELMFGTKKPAKKMGGGKMKKPVAMSYGGKTPKKMGMGGGMSKCRGMGAATRGGNFKMG